MRRTIGTLALALLLAGCGSDTSAESPPADSPPSEAAEVTLVSATAGGGQTEAMAIDVTDEGDLTSYVSQFDDAFAAEVSAAVRKVDGGPVLAQVVSIGCDVPPSASLQAGVIVPEKVADPKQECYAPVTTVALAVG